MPQLRWQVSEKMISQLREFRKHHPHFRVRQKIDAVLMHALDFAQDDIARFLGVTDTTVRSYMREYAEGGLDARLHFEVGGSVSKLTPHRTGIQEEFKQRPPANAREAGQPTRIVFILVRDAESPTAKVRGVLFYPSFCGTLQHPSHQTSAFASGIKWRYTPHR